jgi:hypothetical protein
MRFWLAWLALAACGDDTAGIDAGAPLPDAGFDAGPSLPDGGFDAGWGDAGPRATGCELLDRDAGAGDAGTGDAGVETFEPDGYPPIEGPGGPSVDLSALPLHTACAHLDGGETDRDHHNTVLVWNGYLFMPFAHEAGGGGIAVFEIDDPCAPEPIAIATSETMRETHAAGLTTLGGRHYMAVTSLDGIMIFDVTDVRDMRVVSNLTLPGVVYPDSYKRVVMSIFWQAPFMYVGAADNGVFVVDASDPAAPVLVATYEPSPNLRVGGVHVIGTLGVLIATEGNRVNLLDLSDPRTPVIMPGGTFLLSDGTVDRFGRPELRLAYFGHVSGNYAYFAQQTFGAGLIVYDLTDPTAPSLAGHWPGTTPASGGYVFLKEGTAFVGLSNYGMAIDVTDPTAPAPLARFDMMGDLDTVVPIGNVVVVSVDDDAIPDQASSVMPFSGPPDSRAPIVNRVVPSNGEVGVALSARVGLSFDEFVELGTVWRGSVRVQEVGSETPLDGWYSGQEGIVSFWPRAPLRPDTDYEVIVPVGGVTDVSGNPVTTAFRSTFRTTSCDP